MPAKWTAEQDVIVARLNNLAEIIYPAIKFGTTQLDYVFLAYDTNYVGYSLSSVKDEEHIAFVIDEWAREQKALVLSNSATDHKATEPQRDESKPPMKQYRKLPIVIEAMQYTGANIDELNTAFGFGDIHPIGDKSSDNIYIRTLEGRMEAQPGDYIIRGIKGELYPCRCDIFEATYEAV